MHSTRRRCALYIEIVLLSAQYGACQVGSCHTLHAALFVDCSDSICHMPYVTMDPHLPRHVLTRSLGAQFGKEKDELAMQLHAKLAAAAGRFAVVTDAPSLKVRQGQMSLHLSPPGTARAAGLPDRRKLEAAAAAGGTGARAAGRAGERDTLDFDDIDLTTSESEEEE